MIMPSGGMSFARDDQAKKITYHLLQTRSTRLERELFSNLMTDNAETHHHSEKSEQR
jgi:hypothetical protein